VALVLPVRRIPWAQDAQERYYLLENFLSFLTNKDKLNFSGVFMKVVMIDAANMPGEAWFPSLNLTKYGWEQYLTIEEDDIEKVVWRCDCIVAAKDPVDKAMLDKSFKLQLIVAAGDSTDHIDLVEAEKRGISVCNVPGRDPSNIEDDKKICREVVSAINAHLKGNDYNRVT